MESSSLQNQSINDLLEQLKSYEEREKAFQTHLKMKDIEIQNLEKEIKKLRGDTSQLNQEENEAEEDSDISNEDMKQENANKNQDKNIYVDPYFNEYINELIEVIKYKNKEYEDKNKQLEQMQLSENDTFKQGYKKCKDIVKENLEFYNMFQAGILEILKFENGLEKNQIELLMIKLKALEQYKNELEFECKEANNKINENFEKM